MSDIHIDSDVPMTKTKIHIEDNIPIPVRDTGGRYPVYPYRDLRVGQSFFAVMPCLNTSQWHRSTGFKFRTQTVTENGIRGTRCWRVS